jgi:hypothetical protein
VPPGLPAGAAAAAVPGAAPLAEETAGAGEVAAAARVLLIGTADDAFLLLLLELPPQAARNAVLNPATAEVRIKRRRVIRRARSCGSALRCMLSPFTGSHSRRCLRTTGRIHVSTHIACMNRAT